MTAPPFMWRPAPPKPPKPPKRGRVVEECIVYAGITGHVKHRLGVLRRREGESWGWPLVAQAFLGSLTGFPITITTHYRPYHGLKSERGPRPPEDELKRRRLLRAGRRP